jgi:hypothetical protein
MVGGSGLGDVNSIKQTLDGGYIVAGETFSFGAGLYDVWVLKLNSDGTIAWQKTYGGNGSEMAHSIQQTSDGGYVVTGETHSFGAGGGDVWVLKLNSDGTIAWQKTYGGNGSDTAHSIQQTLDGGYIVAGETDSFGAGDVDFWIIKLDVNGEIPYCSAMGTSTATISDTSAVIQDTSVVPLVPSEVSADTPASPQDTLATTALICGPPIYDGTGTWTYSISNNWAVVCPPRQDETGTAIVTQTGQDVTMVSSNGDTFTGGVSGAGYNLSTSYPEQGGTVTANLSFTLSSDTSGSGTVAWTWTDGISLCNGGSDLSVNLCLGKPSLQTPIGPQPTYQWSVNGVGWTYYRVYVQNLSTGTTYGSGWVESSSNTWDQPSPLPWGNYRTWAQVYYPQCGISALSDPQDFTVGNCASKPTLTVVPGFPGDDQPTFQWDAGTNAQWDYFRVYVKNISKSGATDSGWINSSLNTWTPPSPLPWGNCQAWVQVYHPQCALSPWSDPTPQFVAGDCAGTPGLQPIPPGDNQPTYNWSGTGGQWTYFQVYVKNLSTNANYESGWVESPSNNWDQPSPLPSGNYRAWARVYHPQCGISDWSVPQDWTVP